MMAVTKVSTIQNRKAPVRKPKLAPLRIANIHHVQYLQEKALEKEKAKFVMADSGVAISRPVSLLHTNAKFCLQIASSSSTSTVLYSKCWLMSGVFLLCDSNCSVE